MNSFEKHIERIQTEAREQRQNINISIVALNNIYENLSEEQKQNKDIVQSFTMVLNNL